MKQHLGIGQKVNFVDHNGDVHQGEITAVHGENAATVAIKGGTAVCEQSDKKERGTFHFPTEKAADATASAKAASK